MSWAGRTASVLHGVIAEEFDQPRATAIAVADGDIEYPSVEPGSAANALFDIGSITKTMTAILLADVVLNGEASLRDPIGGWMDAGPNGRITLEELATHRSGLPRLAPNAFDWEGFSEADPYAGFGVEHLEDGLRSAKRVRARAAEYSNFGYQVLGVVLERITGLAFADIIRTRLFEPLGMGTACLIEPSVALIQGFDDDGPAAPWTLLIYGPGGVAASATDVAAYARAVVAPPAAGVGDAIRLTLERRVNLPTGGLGLGWTFDGHGTAWHNGGTAGFSSMMAADLSAKRGIVAMVNVGGLTPRLDEAVLRAIRADDPESARPEPAGDEWRAITERVARDVVATDWKAVRAAMAPATRKALSRAKLALGWRHVMRPRGELASFTLERLTKVGGVVTAEFALVFPEDVGGLSLYFNENEELVGIRIT